METSSVRPLSVDNGRPRLFAMVTTRKSQQYTPTAIQTFLASTHLRPVDRIVLISNDDPEVSAAFSDTPRLEIINNPVPQGFAANANEMIDEALRTQSDLFFMNNDIVFFDRWLEPLLGRDDIVLSPLSNREVPYVATVMVVSSQHVALTKTLKAPMELQEYQSSPRIFQAIAEAHHQHSKGLLPVIVLPFFCIRLPLPVLQKVGKLDTRFGVAGGEDYDYCFRLWLAGIPVSFELNSYLLHFWGKSTTIDNGGPSYDKGFLELFKEKWGEKLFSVALEESVAPIDNDSVARACIERGDLAGVIRALQVRENPIFIP